MRSKHDVIASGQFDRKKRVPKSPKKGVKHGTCGSEIGIQKPNLLNFFSNFNYLLNLKLECAANQNHHSFFLCNYIKNAYQNGSRMRA